MNRAWSTLEIKSLDDDARTFEGIASTPTTDRQGDIVEPMGAEFTLPIPMLWQHGRGSIKDPVGWITDARPNKDGIPVKGKFARVEEPASLKEDLDRAWALVKSKLVRGLSIGFDPLESVPIKGSFGEHILRWSFLELSPVTIPANAEASILSVKSNDESQLRAASGAQKPQGVVRLTPPAGVPAQLIVGRNALDIFAPRTPKGKAMTTQEQIASFENKRAASVGRNEAIMAKAAEENRTLDGTETEEYDNLASEVKNIDAHLVRLKAHQATLVQTAKPVDDDAGKDDATTKGNSYGRGAVMGKSSLPPGIRYTRMISCIVNAKGNLMQAEVLSRQYMDSSPEVNVALKTAVAAGTTQHATNAAPLAQLQDLASEFVEFLRPQTLLGRIPNIRRVPFNIRFVRQTAGSTGTFVGEGLPKPLGKMDFELLSLTWAKAATIMVFTDELFRFSSPSAEALARDDLAAGIARYLDVRFIDPAYSGVANVSPASITNGVTPIASQGNTVALITSTVQAAIQPFITANLDLGGLVWVMSPGTALHLGLKRTTQDIFAFPGLTATGGTFFGYPVIVSNNVAASGSPSEQLVVLMSPSDIMLADDGGVDIAMSTEASLQMDDAPTNPVTSSVSMFQSNMIALRAERYINWMKRRAAAVVVIGNVDW